ncbi:hypothetical protein B0H16DRAFT_1705238 [Mycena metata]|uniref:Uncharacterized protein n=1 Tax=Mycena metata TaxID=1033252 RepID=A0AAD7DZT1_9AGAR|nr:hypothetical protein B0H16DRAFT_1705238 [Mycena metata]
MHEGGGKLAQDHAHWHLGGGLGWRWFADADAWRVVLVLLSLGPSLYLLLVAVSHRCTGKWARDGSGEAVDALGQAAIARLQQLIAPVCRTSESNCGRKRQVWSATKYSPALLPLPHHVDELRTGLPGDSYALLLDALASSGLLVPATRCPLPRTRATTAK